MKSLLTFSIISLVILSGCTTRVVENIPEDQSPTPDTRSTGGVPAPIVYSTPAYSTPYGTPYNTPYETPYSTPYSTPYDTPYATPTNTSEEQEPKVYHVNIVQGVGVADGAG